MHADGIEQSEAHSTEGETSFRYEGRSSCEIDKSSSVGEVDLRLFFAWHFHVVPHKADKASGMRLMRSEEGKAVVVVRHEPPAGEAG